MKKMISLILNLTFILLICSGVSLAEPMESEESISAEEFIKRVVNVLGLEHKLPKDPSINDYIGILETEGIIPKGSYNAGESLTRKEMAVVINEALTPCYQGGFYSNNPRRIIYSDERITPIKVSGFVKVKSTSDDMWRELRKGINLNKDDLLWTDQDSSVTIKFGDIGRVYIGPKIKGSIEDLVTNQDKDVNSCIKEYILPFIKILPCQGKNTITYNSGIAGGVRN